MTDPNDPKRTCSLCDEDFESRRWILLNRYIIGTGTHSANVEGVNDCGENAWDMHGEVATGPVLHFPDCLLMWLDVKAISVDADASKGTDQ